MFWFDSLYFGMSSHICMLFRGSPHTIWGCQLQSWLCCPW